MEPSDLGPLGRLLASRGDESDAVDLGLVVGDPDGGFDTVAVVVDGERIVSTAALLDETVYLDGVAIPAGQVELVATDPDYEGRGLVRALMSWAHERSRQRGHLMQVMIGIPYFYRQFGYDYAIPMHPWREVCGERPRSAVGVTVRRATADDIGALHALHEGEQARFGLRMPHSPACWRWIVARDGSHQWVADHDGVVAATCRSVPPEEGGAVGEVAARDAEAAVALLDHCLVEAGQVVQLRVQHRPGTVAGDAIEPFLAAPAGPGAQEWYYARIEHVGPLLQHLEPVLVRRLHDAGLAYERRDVLISWFRGHVRFAIDAEGITGLTTGGPEQAPGSKGGSGVPPDALPALLFGPYGAEGLEERFPDCYLDTQRELMAALFPPVTADLLTFYLPT
ncbi:MAG: GNAT family N-acetyltransferase [Acidimicrobiales bacterium]